MCARPKGSKNRPKVSPLVEEIKKRQLPESEIREMAENAMQGKTIDTESPFQKENLKVEIVDESAYNPFKNPQFRKKIGLKE